MITEEHNRADERRHMFRQALAAVKDAVPVSRYLEARGVEVRHGRARCPIHGGDNPQAFSIRDSGRRWHCFRCDRGGDVIDLARALEGGELWEAMMLLATRYSIVLPERPDCWREWENTKGRVRSAATQHVAEVYQRRLTKLYAPLVLVGGESPYEELETLDKLAKALWPVSLQLAGRRVSGEE